MFFSIPFLLSSFRTSRGYRCRRPPPAPAPLRPSRALISIHQKEGSFSIPALSATEEGLIKNPVQILCAPPGRVEPRRNRLPERQSTADSKTKRARTTMRKKNRLSRGVGYAISGPAVKNRGTERTEKLLRVTPNTAARHTYVEFAHIGTAFRRQRPSFVLRPREIRFLVVLRACLVLDRPPVEPTRTSWTNCRYELTHTQPLTIRGVHLVRQFGYRARISCSIHEISVSPLSFARVWLRVTKMQHARRATRKPMSRGSGTKFGPCRRIAILCGLHTFTNETQTQLAARHSRSPHTWYGSSTTEAEFCALPR